jgi:hypothetical protein
MCEESLDFFYKDLLWISHPFAFQFMSRKCGFISVREVRGRRAQDGNYFDYSFSSKILYFSCFASIPDSRILMQPSLALKPFGPGTNIVKL